MKSVNHYPLNRNTLIDSLPRSGLMKLLIPSAILFGIVLPAGAQILLSDDFDSYANQAAFQAAWPTTGTFTTGTLTGTLSASAPNSIAFAATPATQRNDRSFTESSTPSATNLILFSVDFYDSNAAASPYREFAQFIDGAGTSSGQLVSLGLNNNLTSSADGGNYYMARILGGDGGQGVSAFFKLNLGGASTLRSTGWHNLAVTISDTAFNFYVDGIFSETVANTITLRSYDSVRLGSGITSANTANFDNVRVEINPTVIPEPSGAMLLLAGFGALAAHRRRR
jgi:PEP-CTERM motif